MLPGAQQPISNGGETKLFFCPRHGKELWLWEVTPSCSTSFDQTPKGSIISEPPLIGLGCFLTSSVWEFCSVPPSTPPPPSRSEGQLGESVTLPSALSGRRLCGRALLGSTVGLFVFVFRMVIGRYKWNGYYQVFVCIMGMYYRSECEH